MLQFGHYIVFYAHSFSAAMFLKDFNTVEDMFCILINEL